MEVKEHWHYQRRNRIAHFFNRLNCRVMGHYPVFWPDVTECSNCGWLFDSEGQEWKSPE